jgi:hypothetical protein
MRRSNLAKGSHRLITRSLAHIRQHLVAYLALFFSLAGTSWAVSNGPPFVRGGGEIRTGAVEVEAMPWPPESPSPGPVLLELPGFGELFVAQCQLLLDLPGTADGVRGWVGYRNTTDHPVETPGLEPEVVQPGATPEVVQPGATNPNISADTDGMRTQQFAYRTAAKQAGDRQTRTHVATVVISGVGDLNTNTCRFQAQATIQSAEDR